MDDTSLSDTDSDLSFSEEDNCINIVKCLKYFENFVINLCIKGFKQVLFIIFCFSKDVLHSLNMSCGTLIYVRQNVQRSLNCFRTHCI